MIHDQMCFDVLFGGQTYCLRGYEPRDWHVDATMEYSASVSDYLIGMRGDGDGDPHVWTAYAGTGSGKTQLAGHIASLMLNQKHARWIVLICPNRSILHRTRKVFREAFGIHLDIFKKSSHAHRGCGSRTQGYITTYQQVLEDPTLNREICGPEFLVIFDEVHHLGEKPGWGASAIEAFGRVRFLLCLTGTPWRHDNVKIPFVTYEELAREEEGAILRFRADFTYTLGQAVAAGYCRKPMFFYHDATVEFRDEGRPGVRVITFEDTLAAKDDELASRRLRAAVDFRSDDREAMLASALRQVHFAGRKVIIYLGGDTDSERTPTEDARIFLPATLAKLGYTEADYEVILGDTPDAQKKIDEFGTSGKWILIAINKVSEGVDIPELSAAIFLTSVTAKQTTVQRIGRTLRRMGEDDPWADAWVFMFRDRRLREISDEIEAEIESEVDLAEARRRPVEGTGDDPERRYRAEARSIGDGKLIEVTYGGESATPEELDAIRRELRDFGLPTTHLAVFLELKMRRRAHDRD